MVALVSIRFMESTKVLTRILPNFERPTAFQKKLPFNELLTDYATTDHDYCVSNQLTFNDL